MDRSRSNNGEEVTDPDRLIDMNYSEYLRGMTKKFHGNFLDYDVYTGTWRFKVEHFWFVSFFWPMVKIFVYYRKKNPLCDDDRFR